jgi:hypothetical protein
VALKLGLIIHLCYLLLVDDKLVCSFLYYIFIIVLYALNYELLTNKAAGLAMVEI